MVSPRRATLALVLAAAACAPDTGVVVQGNAAWSDDGALVLLAEARYETPRPDTPWWAETRGHGWRLAFVEADADLQPLRELSVRPDPTGGGALNAPLFWLRDAGRVVGRSYDEIFVLDLATSDRRLLEVPPSEGPRLLPGFVDDGTGLRGLVSGFAPSPGGDRVALMLTLAYEGPGGTFDLRFAHALAFFDGAGTYEGAVPLSRWDGTSEDLALAPPVPDLGPPPVDPTRPPDRQGLLQPSRFLWAKDGSGVFVVDVDRDEAGVPTDASEAVFVDAATRAVRDAPEVPAVALPTRGGPVADDGRVLLVDAPAETPNAARVVLEQAAGWTGFDAAGRVPVREATYAR